MYVCVCMYVCMYVCLSVWKLLSDCYCETSKLDFV